MTRGQNVTDFNIDTLAVWGQRRKKWASHTAIFSGLKSGSDEPCHRQTLQDYDGMHNDDCNHLDFEEVPRY